MEIQSDEFLTFALIRFCTDSCWCHFCLCRESCIYPTKYETKLFNAIHYTQDEIIRWIRIAVRNACDHGSTKHAIAQMKDRLIRIDQLYFFFNEERGYTKKATHIKGRKPVVYRELILSYNSLEVLNRLHLHENELIELPEHFRMMIKERFRCSLNLS